MKSFFKFHADKGRFFLVLSGIVLGLVTALITFELYLRTRGEFVIRTDSKKKVLADQDADFMYESNERGKRLRKNIDVVIRNHGPEKKDIRIVTNSYGFRDDEIPKIKAENEYRILALGDSITFGDYLAKNDVYVERTEYYLNRASKNKKYRVINAGVGGIGLEEEINILEDTGFSVSPDLVVFGFYLNDDAPPGGYPGELGYKNWIRRKSLAVDTIYRKMIINKWFKDKSIDPFKWYSVFENSKWYESRDDFMKMVKAADYDWGRAWTDGFWVKIDKEFRRLKSLADAKKTKILIVNFPVEFQVGSVFIEDKPQQLMKMKAWEFGFLYLDLLPALRVNRSTNQYFDQVHPNKAANDLIGKNIADFINKSVF